MNLRLVFAFSALAFLVGCGGTYSGYRSDCACLFEPINSEEREII